MSWNHDAFGNRLAETQGGSPAVAMPTSSSASYNANNQLLSSSLNLGSALVYDAAGDVTNDGTNLYLYDAEGRICAVNSTNNLASSYRGLTGYVYDAAGIRVAKGPLTRFTCDFNPANSATYNGFAANTSWVLGQGQEQVGEWKLVGSTWTWQHSNVSAGKLLGTYDTKGLHFYFNDWLGSRRVQTNALGQLEQSCRSLPYGNGETCTLTALATADDPTEQHFTGCAAFSSSERVWPSELLVVFRHICGRGFDELENRRHCHGERPVRNWHGRDGVGRIPDSACAVVPGGRPGSGHEPRTVQQQGPENQRGRVYRNSECQRVTARRSNLRPLSARIGL